nr:MAG TPA: hypothetical protein [Caudoviricetes sp.]
MLFLILNQFREDLRILCIGQRIKPSAIILLSFFHISPILNSQGTGMSEFLERSFI